MGHCLLRNADGSFALVNDSVVSADGSKDKLIAEVHTGFRHRRKNWFDDFPKQGHRA